MVVSSSSSSQCSCAVSLCVRSWKHVVVGVPDHGCSLWDLGTGTLGLRTCLWKQWAVGT